jgi:hypothetical protein
VNITTKFNIGDKVVGAGVGVCQVEYINVKVTEHLAVMTSYIVNDGITFKTRMEWSLEPYVTEEFFNAVQDYGVSA